MNDAQRQAIYKLGLKTGVLDGALSAPDNWMTDYGSCEEQLLAFARGVAEQCAKLCEDEARVREDAGKTHPEDSDARGRCFSAARAATNCARAIRTEL